MCELRVRCTRRLVGTPVAGPHATRLQLALALPASHANAAYFQGFQRDRHASARLPVRASALHLPATRRCAIGYQQRQRAGQRERSDRSATHVTVGMRSSRDECLTNRSPRGSRPQRPQTQCRARWCRTSPWSREPITPERPAAAPPGSDRPHGRCGDVAHATHRVVAAGCCLAAMRWRLITIAILVTVLASIAGVVDGPQGSRG